MEVGFDAKRFFLNYTGLGNYARFLVNSLCEFAPENSYVLYTPRIKNNAEVNPVLAHKNIRVVSPTGGYKLFKSAWRSWLMTYHQSMSSLSVYHGLSQELPVGLPTHIAKVVTVHDLIFMRFPELYKPVDVVLYKAKVKSACNKADVVVAISKQTADDLVGFLGVNREKIKVVYQGCHSSFLQRVSSREKDEVRKKYNLPARFVLNVGTVEKRKNARLLIEAVDLIPKAERIPVVIVGRATHYKKELLELAAEKKLADEITWIHDAAFKDLPAIYQLADLFVYPSRFEGFGIPLVEAIESGVPVISSTGSCFSEAAGPDSFYVNPDDKDELANQIRLVLSHPEQRKKMISGSSNYVQRFRPEVIAGEFNAIYRQLKP